MRAKLLLVVLFVLAIPSTFAATCTSKATGNWNASTTWNCSGAGTVPASADTVVLASGFTVTVNAAPSDPAAASITLNGANSAQTQLTINGGFTLHVTGAVTVNNTASSGSNRVVRVLVQPTAQLKIDGSLALNNSTRSGSVADLTIGADPTTLVTVGGSINFSGTTNLGSVTFAGAGTLAVAGNIDNDGALTAGTGTVIYNGNGTQNIGTYTYWTLTIGKTAGTANATAAITSTNLNIGTVSGAVAVNGNFTATSAALSTSSGAALSLTGNLTGTTTTFTTASSGAITLTGALSATSTTFTNAATGPVTISGGVSSTSLTFDSGDAGLTSLGANSSAASLTFASGSTGLVSMTGGTTLSVTGNCTTAVTRSGSGYVIGNLKLTYPAGSPTCTYPVGDGTNYTPITVALTGATAGTITGSVSASAPPNLSLSPLNSTKYVNRSWTLGAGGDTATATSYNATLNWVAADIQGGANYQNFIVAENQGGWVVPNPGFGSNAATSIVASNVTTAFTSSASFGVGEPYACLPPSNAPAGVSLACVCDNFGRASLNPSTIFNSNWLLSTSSGSFGIPKIVNQGRLELTDNTGNNASAATVPGIFPAAGNYISVEFQQYAYNGSGADGIAVTLSDYSVAPTPGAYGGSLGYAQKTGINGFAGGWIGVALDEYGNYENNTEGRSGGTPPCGGTCPDSVGIRGSGSGNAATSTNYPWLAGNTTIGSIDQPGATPGPGYMYQIIVDARNYTGGAKTALVSVNRDATTKTGANYTTVVSPFDAYVVNPSQAVVPTNWQISFTGSTGGATNVHEIGNLKICAQTVIAPTGSSTAAGFNAIDTALPNTKQNALFGHIYMKLASVPFKLNVAALAAPVGGVSQGVNTAYASSGSKTVTVKLIDDSQAGGSCIASSSACTACSKTVVATQNMTFTSGDAGFKTSANFTFTGAYKRLIAQMSDGTTTGCSVDAFSVRPAYYALSSSVSAPTKAGASFTITATPKDVGGTTLAVGTGQVKLDNSKAPVAGGTQTLLLQSWNAGATSGSFIYNDVGNFTLPANAIYDSSFGNAAGEAQDQTNGDCNPGSGTTPYVPLICYGYSGTTCNNASPYNPDSSGKYSCDIGSPASSPIGRFYPDHYEASVAATPGCSTNGFTYMGQPFMMTSATAGAVQVKALAAGQTFSSATGLPSFTTGYSNLSSLWFGAQNGSGSTTDLIQCINSTLNTTANRCALTVLPRKAAPSTAWVAGVYTAPATTFFFDPPKDTQTTPDTSWGPYDSLNVGVFVSDADGSTLTIPGGQSFTLNSNLYQAVNGSTPMKERYGRMRVQNTSGSDQIPLAVPVWLEYWGGSAWVPNTLDTSCTTLASSPAGFGGNTASKACFGSCTSTTSGGVGSIYTSSIKTVGANAVSPSYSSTQFSYGLRNVILSAPNPKQSGMIGISIEAPTWLEIGPNDPTGADPIATVRFGSYNSRFIFLRENY